MTSLGKYSIICYMNVRGQIVPYSDPQGYERAHEAARGLDAEIVDNAAMHAGFRAWVMSANSHTFGSLKDGVVEELALPFPSPAVDAIREAAGVDKPIDTSGIGWTLGLKEEATVRDDLDTGLTLISHMKPAEGPNILVPLDVALNRYTLDFARPDRIQLKVGDGQLRQARRFEGADAQYFLIMGARFLQLLASGEAPDLPEFPSAPPKGWRRALTRGKSKG